MSEIGVLGAGSWGTALSIHLAGVGYQVHLWARRPEFAAELRRERRNVAYLPDAEIPESVRPTSDLGDLVNCDTVLVVVPSHGFRVVLREFLAARGGAPLTVVSATKGVEVETTARMSQVTFEEGLAADSDVQFAVFSGPTFAGELAAGMPSAAVIAAEDGALASVLRESFATPRLRLYSSSDVVGVELGGASKNVIAVAAGVVAGLGLGHNTAAALITRGLHEVTRLGVAFGGKQRTLSGLAGLGDLVLTCTGGPSRNRRTGFELASGKSLAEIQQETTMVAEGVRNSLAISRLASQKGVEMPITQQMMRVLYEDKDPRLAVEELMTRERKSESEL